MIEAVITGLIYLCLIVLAVYLVVWVLGQLGIAIPDQALRIIWIIVALIAVLVLVRTVLPAAGIRLVSDTVVRMLA